MTQLNFDSLIDDVKVIILSFLKPWESKGLLFTNKQNNKIYPNALRINFNLTIAELNDFTKKSDIKLTKDFKDYCYLFIESCRLGLINLAKLSIKNGKIKHKNNKHAFQMACSNGLFKWIFRNGEMVTFFGC